MLTINNKYRKTKKIPSGLFLPQLQLQNSNRNTHLQKPNKQTNNKLINLRINK